MRSAEAWPCSWYHWKEEIEQNPEHFKFLKLDEIWKS
jgi:uncharacterized protein involved in tolerance to divalent cations